LPFGAGRAKIVLALTTKRGLMKPYYIKHVMLFVTGWVLLNPEISSATGEEYNIIIEKNLFSPTRQKWVTPPKTPPKKQISKAMMPELSGTIISDKKKVALLSFRQPPASISTSTRSTRRTPGKKGKSVTPAPVVTPRSNNSRILSVGDRFGDYQLVAIEDKQVTIECDGEKIQLNTRR
jgi:hypothetical protein